MSPGGDSGTIDTTTGDSDDTDSTTDGSTDADSETTTDTNSSADSEIEPLFPDHDTTGLCVLTPGGERLGSLRAAIAETPDEWTTGLSDIDFLPEDWGMLFVTDSVEDHTFWMKGMTFGIDIIFVDDEKTITDIYHAPEPGPDEDGTEQRYPGRGQYVLETTYRWTEHHTVSEGDHLAFNFP